MVRTTALEVVMMWLFALLCTDPALAADRGSQALDLSPTTLNERTLPDEEPDLRWKHNRLQLDRENRGMYHGGVILGAGGVFVLAAGVVLESVTLQGLGSLAVVIGAPVMAGSSRRSQAILAELYNRPPGRGMSGASYGFYGGFWASTLGAVVASRSGKGRAAQGLSALGLICLVTSYGAAASQAGLNQSMRPQRRPRVTLDGLSPMIEIQRGELGRVGAAISGRW